jgi:O-methyltransferase involved in polyketide biosynthesis
MFEMQWAKQVQRSKGGVFFVSGGVLEYFEKATVRQFLTNIAATIPGSHIVFNTTNSNSIAKFFVNRSMQRLGIKADPIRWGMDFINELQSAGNGITVIDQFPVFSRIETDKKWGKSTIWKLKFLDAFEAINIVHLKLGNDGQTCWRQCEEFI